MDDEGRPRGALRAGRFGVRIPSTRDDGTKVHVECTSAPAETFDVAVGADGLHSELRETPFAPETDRLHHIVTAPDFYCARRSGRSSGRLPTRGRR